MKLTEAVVGQLLRQRQVTLAYDTNYDQVRVRVVGRDGRSGDAVVSLIGTTSIDEKVDDRLAQGVDLAAVDLT